MILELRVACPACRAHPGQECRDHTASAVPPHAARIRLARRTVTHSVPLDAGRGDH